MRVLAGSKLNKRKANALSGADREKVEPIVKDLNAIMDDIDQRIAALARECPSEWSTIKEISMQKYLDNLNKHVPF